MKKIGCLSSCERVQSRLREIRTLVKLSTIFLTLGNRLEHQKLNQGGSKSLTQPSAGTGTGYDQNDKIGKSAIRSGGLLIILLSRKPSWWYSSSYRLGLNQCLTPLPSLPLANCQELIVLSAKPTFLRPLSTPLQKNLVIILKKSGS